MSLPKYSSMLFTMHDGYTNVYIEGQLIGVLRDGKLERETKADAYGKMQEVKIDMEVIKRVGSVLLKII